MYRTLTVAMSVLLSIGSRVPWDALLSSLLILRGSRPAGQPPSPTGRWAMRNLPPISSYGFPIEGFLIDGASHAIRETRWASCRPRAPDPDAALASPLRRV